MSNDTDGVVNRCLRLLTKIGVLLIDGKRDPKHVAQILQGIVDTSDLFGAPQFAPLFGTPRRTDDMIVRNVTVNRARPARQAIEATGRVMYTNLAVVDAMPNGEGEMEEVFLFKPDLEKYGGFISDNDLEKEYEHRGLKPVDPFTLAALNEADSAFADEKPNATHWKGADGNWCCAIFDRWFGVREVDVGRRGNGWDDRCWLAGVRK